MGVHAVPEGPDGHQDAIGAVCDALVERLREALSIRTRTGPGFGRVLAADGKNALPLEPDGRRDTDADFGTKTYRGRRQDGTLWEKVQRWFGYKVHLVADAEYELPVAYEVTKASASEMPQARALLGGLAERHPALVEGCEFWTADKGHDDGAMIRRLWDAHRIKPAIDIRAMWKEPDSGARGPRHPKRGVRSAGDRLLPLPGDGLPAEDGLRRL